MKKRYLFILFFISFAAAKSQIGIFWTENFGNGTNCSVDQGLQVNSYNGPNGQWNSTQPGPNGTKANVWYVSEAEGGRTLGMCGKRCQDSLPITKRTLHIGTVPGAPRSAACPTGDCGARYDPGVKDGKVVTDTRAESPVINCNGRSGMVLSFNYIMRGVVGGDSMSVWYFDGAAWSSLSAFTGNPDPAMTSTCTAVAPGDTESVWTAYTTTLPASANNNAFVRIGFRWVNNDDSLGSDPSVAIDSIKIANTSTVNLSPTLTVTIVPPSTVTPAIYCTNTTYQFGGYANPGNILYYHWSVQPGAGVVIQTPNQNGTNINFANPGTYSLTLFASSDTSGSNDTTIVLNVLQTPTVTISPYNPIVCKGSLGTNLYAGGASTYTWSPLTNLTYLNTNGDSVNVNPPGFPVDTAVYTLVGTSAGGCPSLPKSVTVTVIPVPVPILLASPDSICNGDSTILSVNNMPVNTTYSWTASPKANIGSNTGWHVPAHPLYSGVTDTTFSYYVNINLKGCPPYAQDTLRVVVHPTPTVTVLSDTVDNCNKKGDTLRVKSIPAHGVTYVWSPTVTAIAGDTNDVIVKPTVPTKYYVTPFYNGCRGLRDSVLVLIGDTTTAHITAGYNYMCIGQSNVLYASPQNNITNNSYTYNWQPSQYVLSQSVKGDTVLIDPSATTVFTLTVKGTCVKHATDTVKITVENCLVPNVHFTASTHTICVNRCITFTDLTQTNSTVPLFYTWIFPGGTISPPVNGLVHGDTLTFEVAHHYSLKPFKVCYHTSSDLNINGVFPVTEIVSTGIGQKDSVTDYIKVDPSPLANAGVNQTVNLGNSVTLTSGSQGNSNITNYYWTESDSGYIACKTCASTVVTPSATTVYTLTVKDAGGCSAAATVTVTVELVCKEVFIANAFSPNNDNFNDVLHVKSNCLTNFSFKIFDRWGEKVFETTDLNYGWDGTFRGKAMDTAVFMYTLDGFLSNGDAVKKSGTISLMR